MCVDSMDSFLESVPSPWGGDSEPVPSVFISGEMPVLQLVSDVQAALPLPGLAPSVTQLQEQVGSFQHCAEPATSPYFLDGQPRLPHCCFGANVNLHPQLCFPGSVLQHSHQFRILLQEGPSGALWDFGNLWVMSLPLHVDPEQSVVPPEVQSHMGSSLAGMLEEISPPPTSPVSCGISHGSRGGRIGYLPGSC